jgi:hypothetical protein
MGRCRVSSGREDGVVEADKRRWRWALEAAAAGGGEQAGGGATAQGWMPWAGARVSWRWASNKQIGRWASHGACVCLHFFAR